MSVTSPVTVAGSAADTMDKPSTGNSRAESTALPGCTVAPGAHYKWAIRRRFPNELLKRTPRLLRIFKLGRYLPLACIWYRQANQTPLFHPLSSPSDVFLSPLPRIREPPFHHESSPFPFLGAPSSSFSFYQVPGVFSYPVSPYIQFTPPRSPSPVFPLVPITRRRDRSLIPKDHVPAARKFYLAACGRGVFRTYAYLDVLSEVGHRRHRPRKEQDFHFNENTADASARDCVLTREY